MALFIEVDGPATSRTIPANDKRGEMVLWSQPAILCEDGKRGTVMFDLSLEDESEALQEGVRYALSIRAFEMGEYGSLAIRRRFKPEPETSAKVSKVAG